MKLDSLFSSVLMEAMDCSTNLAKNGVWGYIYAESMQMRNRFVFAYRQTKPFNEGAKPFLFLSLCDMNTLKALSLNKRIVICEKNANFPVSNFLSYCLRPWNKKEPLTVGKGQTYCIAIFDNMEPSNISTFFKKGLFEQIW